MLVGRIGAGDEDAGLATSRATTLGGRQRESSLDQAGVGTLRWQRAMASVCTTKPARRPDQRSWTRQGRGGRGLTTADGLATRREKMTESHGPRSPGLEAPARAHPTRV